MIKLWPGLGLILLAFPFVELWFSLAVVHWLGFGACFAWWLGSVAVGLLILRTQGLALRTQMMMLAGGQRNPLAAVLWMARRTLAAILLLLPGFLSDAVALLLLLPWPMPRTLRVQAQWRTDSPDPFRREAATQGGSDAIIDGEYQRVDSGAAPISHQEDK